MSRSSYRALWRVLVPTWRFFDRVQASPRVYVEIDRHWRETLVRPRRRWFDLVFNPAANLHHADQNLLQRLLLEVGQTDAPDKLTSYQLLTRRLDPGHSPWRFKITWGDEDVLLSPLFETLP